MVFKMLWCLFFVLAITACSNRTIETEKFSEMSQSSVAVEPSLLQHLQYLSSDRLQGRKVGSYGNELTQQYLVEQLTKEHVLPFGESYLAPFLIDGILTSTVGNNVVALVPGSEYSDKFIVLSAHFDHLGGHGNQIFNGADDNASGTSALLHYAKLLKKSPLRYSVILLFTDGEEANLKGAKAFVKQNQHILSNIILNINVDMIAGSQQTKKLRYISKGLSTILSSKQLSAYITQQQQATIKIKKGFRRERNSLDNNIKWQLASDHGAFYRKNIPFIYFGVGTHNNYHKTSDTYDNINQPFFIKAVESIYQQIIFLDRNL
jgi:Zn-dependent M28 family amino/carboxypeptidase